MSILANINVETDVEESGDNLGGGLRTGGAYQDTISKAYLHVATSGAKGVVLELVSSNGQTHRETVYFTSGTAKGGNYFYIRNGQKYGLPGYNLINDLCLLLTGKGLFANQATSTRTVDVYNFDAKKEIPTSVEALDGLWGKKITTGIIQVIENKREEVDGEWIAVADTVTKSSIDKFFDATTGQTATEKQGNVKGAFLAKWEEKNAGVVHDRTSKEPLPPSSKSAGAGASSPAAAASVASLFDI